jgi:transcriptional regulator with XRE-family HTH domain
LSTLCYKKIIEEFFELFMIVIMKTQNTNGRALRDLRSATGLSLRFLAQMVGLSYGALQMIEIGRRSLTAGLAKKLSVSLGCDWKALLEGKVIDLDGNTYTKKSYDFWKLARVESREIEDVIELTCLAVKNLLLAAATDSSGQPHPDRFREVVAGLHQMVDEIVSEQSLLDSLNGRYSLKRVVSTREKIKLSDLRSKYSHTKEWREWDSPDWSGEMEVEVDRSEFTIWHPLYGPNPLFKTNRSGPPALVLKYRIELAIRADWLEKKDQMISWTEYQFGGPRSGDAIRVYRDPDNGQNPAYFPNWDYEK